MNQSNNTQKNLKPKNQKKYTEAVNLGKKLSKTPDITKVSVATQMSELMSNSVQTCTAESLSESEREQRQVNWQAAPHARYCHPREEHLLPLQVCYGLGQAAAQKVFQEPVAGFITSAYQWR